jgi:hypothetical protein
MMHLLIYLLKVSACLVVFFGVYYLTLRHFTFHTTNRVCLVAIIVTSFVVPLVPVKSQFNEGLALAVQLGNEFESNNENFPTQVNKTPVTNVPSLWQFAVALYALGAILFSYRFLISLLTLYRFGLQSSVEKQSGVRVKRTNGDRSYTFLNTIFLPRGHTDEIILRHEKTHVEQFHWIDLLLAELASIALWFNPVIFLLKGELKLQHEFLADRSVLSHGFPFEEYAQCLVRNIGPPMSGNAISPLGSTSIKNRILMMTKKQTSRYAMIIYLMMIPVCAVLLMSFGRTVISTESHEALSNEIAIFQTPGIAPVDLSKVTKVVMYGDRIHPATQQPTKHTGVDFELPLGSDVVSTADGVVLVQQYGDKQGNYVVIRHDETLMTRYYHLEKALVKTGEKVTKGQVIGLVGSTGVFSKGPHLHYEVIKNGIDVDPKDYLPELTGL